MSFFNCFCGYLFKLKKKKRKERKRGSKRQRERERKRMRKAKMILRTVPGGIVLFLLLSGSIAAQDDDSLAGTFLSGKSIISSHLDTIAFVIIYSCKFNIFIIFRSHSWIVFYFYLRFLIFTHNIHTYTYSLMYQLRTINDKEYLIQSYIIPYISRFIKCLS